MRIISLLTTFFAFIIFASCNDDNSIEFSEIQGYYRYNIIDFTTGAIKDSLFACVTISNIDNSDALRIENSILGLLLGKEDKFFILWAVEEIDGKLVPQIYTFLDRSFNSKVAWSVEQELGFVSGTYERKFVILSRDTSLTIFSRKLDGILLLEQRDWMDVGGMWDVQLFGFDQYDRLIFVHKYIESKPWNEQTIKTRKRLYPEEIVVHDAKHTYSEIKDYLVLHEFIKAQSITDLERDKWKNRNSSYSKQWIYWKTEFEDYTPPPMPEFDFDPEFEYENDSMEINE